MTTDQDSITNNDGIVDFKMPLPPPEKLQGLLPRWHVLQDMGVIAELTGPRDGRTNGVTLTVMHLEDSNRPPPVKTVHDVVRHFWNEMAARQIVTHPMPEIA